MSTSNRLPTLAEQIDERFAPLAPERMGSPVHLVINPDEPPWGLVAGFATWFASVALLLLMSLIFVIPYIFPHLMGGNQEALRDLLLTDKTAILLQILSTIPAHLLTLGVVWAVVTHFGKLPFWPTLGWSRSKHFGFWQSAGLALLMLGTGMLITKTLGGQETQLDKIISSSAAARYSTAFLATFTAPLVEEMVYRGVLYSALRRFLVRLNTAAGVAGAARVGTISAVFGVLLLFTLVHVPQYWPNYGVIIVIFILSLTLTLVRAYTGRLLPCFIIHLVFNGASSLLIVLEPYIEKMNPGGEQKAAFIMTLARAVGFFV